MRSSFSRVIKRNELAGEAPPREIGVREVLVRLAEPVPPRPDRGPAGEEPADPAGLREAARAEAERQVALALAEAERLRAEARREGFQAGYAEGRQAWEGEEEKLRRAAQEALEAAQREAEEVRARARAERAALLAGAEEEILALAVTVAEKVLHAHLQVAPAAVVEVVRAALREAGAAPAYSVRVNPADMDYVRENLASLREDLPAEAHLEVLPAAGVRAGGCLVETPHSRVDATLDGQLARVAAALAEGGGGE